MKKQLLDITLKTVKINSLILLMLFIKHNVQAQAQVNSLGSGLDNSVYCQAVYNNELYAGGSFTTAGGTSANTIAKWSGSAWSAVGTGTNGSVSSMTVYNNELYIGGTFSTAGGVSVNNIARWNGSTWSSVGTGLTGGFPTVCVSMAVYNNELYVGGLVVTAGGVAASRIAKWNGSTWSAVGTGTDNLVSSMTVYNNELYVGGTFTTAGGASANKIAKWNGSAWSAVGTGTDDIVSSMTVYNNELYVGGNFTTAGGAPANKIAKWNGSAWAAVAAGTNGSVSSITVYNNELYIGGAFSTAGGVGANKIAKWDGAWHPVGTGINSTVNSIVVHDGNLYIGGAFTTAFGINANYIVKIAQIPTPTIASTNIQFTNVSPNSLSLTWNNGNGSKHLIVAKSTTSVNQIPVDDQPYSANASFGSGTDLGGGNYVVYNSSGYNVVVNNLNPDNIYHFAIYEFNDSMVSGFENYLITNYPIASHTTMAAEPTVSTNQISFSNASVSGINVLLTSGNGNKRIVVAKQGSAVTAIPVDTFAYAANAGFGTSGTDMGNANYVVYNGTGNSFMLTGLTANTIYHFASYEYNGTTAVANNYITSNPAIGSQSTLTTEPTSPSINIQFTNVSPNSLSLTWTNGNGSKHLVVCKSGSIVNQSPVDGQPYSANTSFGSGSDLGGGNYAVYNGTGNNMVVNNLNPDNIYHFAIYEFNDGTISGTENYYIANYAITSHTTLASEPTVATSQISFSNASFTSMNVLLSPGNGTKRIVVAKQGSAVNAVPTDTFSYNASSFFGTSNTDMGGGNYVVYDGTGNSFNLTGLTANTIYHFASFEYNGSTIPANNYITSNPAIGYQSTLTTEPTTPSTNIQFTNVKDSSMTLSWTVGNGQRRMVVAATSVVTSIPVDGVDHLAKDTFGLGADLGFNNYVVYSGTSNTFNLKGLMPDITYHFAVFEYSGTNTSNNYLLMNPAIGSKSTLIAEPDVPASNLTLSPITNGITTVNWTNGNGVSRIAVVRQGMPINILPDDGNSYTANAVFGSGQDLGQGNFICYVGNSNTFNLQGLDPLNVYYVGIIEYNGSGGGTNYMLNNFPIADNLPVEPTVLSSNMSFSDLTSSSVKVSWTNGDGSYRLLLAKENAPVSKSPVDGAVYVANSVFGSGADLGMANFAVYNGIGNSAVITNLNEGSTYHFSLFEFNKDASGPANYLDSALDGNISILTRIQQNATEKTFEIYPNPSKGEFMVEIQNTKGGLQDAKIVITNILGETIYQSPVATGPGPSKTFIDLSSYSSGIFNLQLISTQGILTTKIVLE